MAARTLFLAATDGCTAVLNYNDLTLTAIGVNIDNAAGDAPVTFFLVTGLFTRTATVAIGASQLVVFPSALSVVLGGGNPNQLTISGLTAFGMGTGSGIGP